MTSPRERALSLAKVGDVVFGLDPNGQGRLLLVYEVDAKGISARNVTTQAKLRFDVDGRTRQSAEHERCVIASTARLPAEDLAVVIGLDRKMRTGERYPDFVLSKDEIQFLLRFERFFAEHLLPA